MTKFITRLDKKIFNKIIKKFPTVISRSIVPYGVLSVLLFIGRTVDNWRASVAPTQCCTSDTRSDVVWLTYISSHSEPNTTFEKTVLSVNYNSYTSSFDYTFDETLIRSRNISNSITVSERAMNNSPFHSQHVLFDREQYLKIL